MIDVEDLCRRLYQSAILAEGRNMPETAAALIDLVETIAREGKQAQRLVDIHDLVMPRFA